MSITGKDCKKKKKNTGKFSVSRNEKCHSLLLVNMKNPLWSFNSTLSTNRGLLKLNWKEKRKRNKYALLCWSFVDWGQTWVKLYVHVVFLLVLTETSRKAKYLIIWLLTA